MAALLIATVSYIGIDKYFQARQAEQLSLFQQGAQAGYQQAVLQLMQQAATCRQVPLFYNNQTINVIAVECLSQAQQSQAQAQGAQKGQ